MKQELTLIAGLQPTTSALWESAQTVSSLESNLVYREWAEVPVQVVDPVTELSANLAQLQDLQARMRYMMREIRFMMKA
ncbi:MAG: hypothetical protein KF681_03055 [Bdellovibrionaceae bacterium]|nr:hypothetical protein [Pseudobdellovibrionaceae bacterium]